MFFGEQTLERGSKGPAVVELQLRLAGFRGTLWDGDFGPGTERQVINFQRDYMGMETPDGIADEEVFQALERFAAEFPIPFEKLTCKCGKCQGFGQGRFKGEFRGNSTEERVHKYEYPGIHKAILHSYRGIWFYLKAHGLGDPILTSGYRCHEKNKLRPVRRSTNHMGKALDFDIVRPAGITHKSKADKDLMNSIRSRMADTAEFQIGWSRKNRKALEPGSIAPTWIHMDVREYDRDPYLNDKFFVKSLEELDSKKLEISEMEPALA